MESQQRRSSFQIRKSQSNNLSNRNHASWSGGPRLLHRRLNLKRRSGPWKKRFSSSAAVPVPAQRLGRPLEEERVRVSGPCLAVWRVWSTTWRPGIRSKILIRRPTVRTPLPTPYLDSSLLGLPAAASGKNRESVLFQMSHCH